MVPGVSENDLGFREWEREWIIPFPKFGKGNGMKKKTFPKFEYRKGMKKSIPIIWERESEAFIFGNGREREFPLTPEEDNVLIKL